MAKRRKEMLEGYHPQEPMRLSKFLSDAGICSRREADRLITAGKILVDGKQAVLGQKVLPEQQIICNGKPVTREEELIFLAINKPVGIECTSDRTNPKNIIDFIHYPKRIYSIGRLDKNSEGLLLMTNAGDMANQIAKACNYHEKEYMVEVNKPVTDAFLKKMGRGVPILDTVTRPCQIRRTGEKSFCIVLTQGLNRQIRRMCEFLGYRVVKLKRIRIMNIHLGTLQTGTYRNVTDAELRTLLQLLDKTKGSRDS